jgi:hypothetical protein
MRARKVVPLVTTVVAVVAVGAVGVASAATGSYSDGPLTATFSASTTHPNCKQLWPVTVTARFHGHPAHATAKYQFLYNGQLVSTVYPFSHTRQNPRNRIWHFYGSFTDNAFGPFGALAVGQTLNVRAVVQDGTYTAYPGLYVTVRQARGCKARRS